MAVIVVFLLLAMTLGLSYAAVRSQSVAATIHRNAARRGSARQAAITGLTIALRKMHNSSWSGVNSTCSGQLSAYETFTVTYTAGDPRLTSASADYADLPFRVTLLATGYAADPDNPQCIATHRARAIVKLVPRALSTEPADWNEITASTVYQWNAGDFELNPPCRIEGPVRLQGTLGVSRAMYWDATKRNGYFQGLNERRLAGLADWRPFNGRVSFYYWWQWSDTLSLLNTTLGVPTTNVSPKTASFHSGLVTNLSYRIYPGGPSYTVPTIGRTQQAISYTPDPLSNPLGLLYRSSTVDVYDDVTVQGTLLLDRTSEGDLHVWGKRNRFAAVSLPPLYGSSQPVQLPAIVCGDDCTVHSNADVTFNGQVTCYDDFEVVSDDHRDIKMAINGGLVTSNLYVRVRGDWNYSETWWDARWTSFNLQKGLPGSYAYFADWLAKYYGLQSDPLIAIKPPSSPVRYHWHTLPNSVYVPAAGDPGLRWDILDWTEKL